MNTNGKEIKALADAARKGNCEQISEILGEVPDIVNVKFQGKFSPLANAMHFKKWDAASLLLELGADAGQALPPGQTGTQRLSHLDAPDDFSKTFMEKLPSSEFVGIDDRKPKQEKPDAPQIDTSENQRIIEENIANLNCGEENGLNEAIHFAAKNGDIKKIEKLIKTNPQSLFSKNSAQKTPAIIAAESGHLQLAAILIENGADVNDFGLDGMTVPMHFAKSGNFNLLKETLPKKPDLGQKNILGQDALLLAASNGHFEVARRILHIVEQTDSFDTFGKTALIYGTIAGDEDFCDAALQFGCSSKHKDKSGKSAEDYAKQSGHREISKMFNEHVPLETVFKKHGIPDTGREPIRRQPLQHKHEPQKAKVKSIADFAPLKEPSTHSIDAYTPKAQDIAEVSVKIRKKRVA